MKAKKQPSKSSERKLVASILKRDRDRRERILRAEKAITAICAKERVKLGLTSLNFQDGKFIPQIQLFSVD